MNIVVCYKLTPDPGDIEVRNDGSISLERAEWAIGGLDLQAIEAGLRLAEATGGKVMALTAGPHQIDTSKLKKDLLSRGPDELFLVVDDAMTGADTAMTSQVLAQAVRKIGQVDLVLCGEGSADLYFQQVGIQLGERLGWPTLNAISQIEAGDGKLVVERSLEEEVEVIETLYPAVLSVTTDINPPRLPTMKEILKASKKPITLWRLADLGLPDDLQNQLEVISTRAPRQVKRKQVIIPGQPVEATRALVDYLAQEGLL
ncbi:MAG: putative electron transfer flavoprotein FixA [Anaerolineaceae bacterium]|nr:putative electron transfer flavoprotein FixA [Anaerolineaceae bacterium]